MPHFHPDDFSRIAEVKDDARRDLLGVNNFRVIQLQRESVCLLVDMEFNKFPFMVRSKNTRTTRQGATCVFTITRKIRYWFSGILRKNLSMLESSGSQVRSCGFSRVIRTQSG